MFDTSLQTVVPSDVIAIQGAFDLSKLWTIVVMPQFILSSLVYKAFFSYLLVVFGAIVGLEITKIKV